MTLVYVLDDVFVRHRPPSRHPEQPERYVAVRDALRAAGLAERGRQLPCRGAQEHEIGLVHEPGYIADLGRRVAGRSGWLDPDTYFSPGTWDAARAAVGAAVDVTLAVLSGQAKRGLAIVRPPGHHAEADRAMGFCLLNNVAVAAAAARKAGAARVAIIDWDVHHGNGTQHMFYGDGSVLYQSCHQHPFFPGTGAASEIGVGEGVGATVNVPLPAGCGDGDFGAVFEDVFVPGLRRFRPELLLVSAGFDAYRGDPLAGMRVTVAGYSALAARICAVADEVAEGRLVAVLEGGYDMVGLAGGVVATLDAMEPRAGVGTAPRLNWAVSAAAKAAIASTLAAHGQRRAS